MTQNEQKKYITTKNGETFEVETIGTVHLVTSTVRPTVAKACGYLINKNDEVSRINGDLTPIEIAEILSRRDY